MPPCQEVQTTEIVREPGHGKPVQGWAAQLWFLDAMTDAAFHTPVVVWATSSPIMSELCFLKVKIFAVRIEVINVSYCNFPYRYYTICVRSPKVPASFATQISRVRAARSAAVHRDCPYPTTHRPSTVQAPRGRNEMHVTHMAGLQHRVRFAVACSPGLMLVQQAETHTCQNVELNPHRPPITFSCPSPQQHRRIFLRTELAISFGGLVRGEGFLACACATTIGSDSRLRSHFLSSISGWRTRPMIGLVQWIRRSQARSHAQAQVGRITGAREIKKLVENTRDATTSGLIKQRAGRSVRLDKRRSGDCRMLASLSRKRSPHVVRH